MREETDSMVVKAEASTRWLGQYNAVFGAWPTVTFTDEVAAPGGGADPDSSEAGPSCPHRTGKTSRMEASVAEDKLDEYGRCKRKRKSKQPQNTDSEDHDFENGDSDGDGDL
ncbi:hypothetical protein B0H13DRAFT_1906167 [Mycena leptocephala]|nr:hypothetical protein B0H13DRAFT_1906167 [Mycena leptocephala]